MKVLEGYRKAFGQLPAEILAAEAEAEEEAAVCVSLGDGKPQGCSASQVTALFVRASGEKTGMTYTQNLEEEPLAVIRRAYESSLYSQAAAPEPMNEAAGRTNIAAAKPENRREDAAYRLDGEARTEEENRGETETYRLDGEARTEEENGGENTDMEVLWEKARQIDDWLAGQAPELSMRSVSITEYLRTTGLVNTKGCSREAACRILAIHVTAASKDGTNRFFDRELTCKRPEEIRADLFAGELAAFRRNRLPKGTLSAGIYRCVVDARVMTNIFITAWQMFTGKNYQNGGTPFAGKLGRQAASPAVSLTDKVSRPGSGFTFALDCEGTWGKDVTLIQNGILTGLMHSLQTAPVPEERSGNAGRKILLGGNIHTDLQIMPKNFGLEPGDASLEELLKELGDGVYIYDSVDVFHSVNTASGEFSIPCDGIVVKGGSCAACVHGLTLNGSLQELLTNIEAVGNDTATLAMPILYSYLVSSPSVLVKALSVG